MRERTLGSFQPLSAEIRALHIAMKCRNSVRHEISDLSLRYAFAITQRQHSAAAPKHAEIMAVLLVDNLTG